MPRISAEARSAAAYRAGSRPPAPPKSLKPAVARIWREIAAAKPADWFDGATLRLLRRYCRTLGQAEAVADELDAVAVSSDAARILERRLVALNASCTTMATKLRLTVQSTVDWHDRKNSERGLGEVAADSLIGGGAVVPLLRSRR
jgi:hypothetical protein